MLNNIASDLDLLLNDLCHIYPYPVTERKFTTFGKGQTYTDTSPGFGEDSAFGTLASTDSYNCEQKLRSDSVQSGHLDVFGLDHSPKILEIPSFPDNGSDPLSDTDHRPISFLERLSKTHPIWFLTEIGRSGAVHLLKDREIGTFIIRNSSQPNTFALSAQFPSNGPNVDHYLLENTSNGYRVQGSNHVFSDITKLVAFYHENLEELPHRLVLPPTIRRAKTLQELTSLSLLGQDFWTSYRFDKGSNLSLSFQGSNNSLTMPLQVECSPLHKSKSEPINITNAKHFKKQKLATSISTQHFKESALSQSEDSLSGSDPIIHHKSSSVTFLLDSEGKVVSAPIIHQPLSGVISCGKKDTVCEMCQSNIHSANKNSDDNWSSGNSGSPKFHTSQTEKQKSNLYSTTSLDLLNIPDNQYFKSSLSDKMSDYEDVWRSSSCATPNSSVQGKKKRHKCKRTCPYPKVSEKSTVTSPTLLNNAVSVIRTDVQNKIHKSIQNNLHTDAGVQTTHSGSIKQKLRKSSSVDIQSTQDRLGESFRSDKMVRATTSTQTSPVKVVPKPRPLKKVDDKDSCTSDSSKSGFKSPVYAEPFDALEAHQTEHVNLVRIRRRSAPSMGLSGRKVKGVSQGPNLQTIISPGFETNESYFEAELDNGANKNHCGEDHRIHMRRSHSMKERSSQNSDRDLSVLDRESIKHVANELDKLHIEKRSYSSNLRTNNFNFGQDSIFEGCEDQNEEQTTPTLSRFPVYRPTRPHDTSRHSMFSELSTIEDLISSVNPQLTVKPLQQIPTIIYSGAMSEYDNLTSHYAAASNAETEFCAPWDTTIYGSLLNSNPKSFPQMDLHSRILAWQQNNLNITQREPGDRSSFHSDSTLVGDSDEETIDIPELPIQPPSLGSSAENLTDVEELPKFPHFETKLNLPSNHNMCDNPIQTENSDDFVSADKKMNKKEKKKEQSPEYKIREYICSLSQDRNTTFGSTIENFIQCTLESQETNPHHVTRNVRQFMTGIKNYLVKHGEGELDNIIQKERSNLNANEILNIDGIIEKALHVCVLRPLKHHIYRLFVEEYTKNGSLPSLSRNIRYARSKTPLEIGLRSGTSVPNSSQMEIIRFHLTKMQKAYSPLKKLEHLLKTTQCIYQCLNGNNGDTLHGIIPVGADDFLPMLIYVVVHCGIVAAEIEADYMWDLINPAVMNTEGGYYLTSLNSAVLVLKNFKEMQETKNTQHESRLPSISDMQGFLKIAMPDELRDSIIWKTLPVRPNMNTRDVCSMIAHKFNITNPQDYGLYYLVKGIETKLIDTDCPQVIKAEFMTNREECVFAYKRTAANIAWPLSLKK